MLYLGFSIQAEKQNMRILHNLFRNTGVCRLDCPQVQSSPVSCVREWPELDAAEGGTGEFVEVNFLQLGETSS